MNKNLLPLFEKLGVKGGGEGLVMAPMVMPVIDLETLDDSLATAQILATSSAVLTNVGDMNTITVPAGEKWSIDFLSWHCGAAAAATRNLWTIQLAGSFPLGLHNFPDAIGTTAAIEQAMFIPQTDLFLVDGDVIEAERMFGVGAQTNNMVVGYRHA